MRAPPTTRSSPSTLRASDRSLPATRSSRGCQSIACTCSRRRRRVGRSRGRTPRHRRMRPLADAHFAGRTNDGVAFDLDGGWQCRVFVLADDLVRVLFVQDGWLKEPRTWMVAPNGRDVAWEGHGRLDVSRFPCPAFRLRAMDDRVVIETDALRASI